ncbi:MAG: hypothetical protein ABFC67_07285 [Mizugakiibacter sp.]|uniref:hypothetical protein n=1 Tax=Mizugakiibacter sp. TaxID=1972610 RepID=UPI0031BDDBED|nr:hypothetical protein [Xanthomonadaceae bacterium]
MTDTPKAPAMAFCATALFVASTATHAADLGDFYGGMAKGCTYDAETNYRVVTAYVDEDGARPKLAHPAGGQRLAPFFGKATLQDNGESYTLTIPIADAKLYGIPVSRLTIYRGIHADIAGVIVTFPFPPQEVRARLAKAGVRLEPHDHGWGDITPELGPADDGPGTQLACDLSM